jgi:hypothetical protein
MQTPNEIRVEHNRKAAQLSKKQLMEQLSESSQSFCSNLRFLINMLWLKNKGDEDICSLKSRVTMATNSNPMTIIEIAGPHFFKYRESLTARKINFFIDQDFVNDVKEAQKVHDIKGDSSSAGEVIKIIKNTFKSFKEAEQTAIMNKAIDMLTAYSKYLIATKQLAAQSTQ